MPGRKPGGPKTGGRKAGTPNRSTASVKAAIETAFKNLGGVDALTRWGEENPGEFYKLWAKLLPKEVHADVEHRQQAQIMITLPDNGRGTEIINGLKNRNG